MIRIDPSKCVGCNACIRACPVNDANISETVDGRNVITINLNAKDVPQIHIVIYVWIDKDRGDKH